MQSSVEGLSPLEEEVRTGRDTTQLGCAPQHGTLPLHRTFLSPVKRKVSWEEPARAEHVLGRHSLVGCDARPLSPMSYARHTCPHGPGSRGWCGQPHPPPLQPWTPPSTRTGESRPRAARGSPRRSRQPQHVEKWPAGGQNPAPHAHLCPHLGSPPSVLGGQRPPARTRTGLLADAAVATPPAPRCSPCKGVHLLP